MLVFSEKLIEKLYLSKGKFVYESNVSRRNFQTEISKVGVHSLRVVFEEI